LPQFAVRAGFYYIFDMKIGNLMLSGKVILAPLAGVADTPFRLVAKRFGAALVYTEMASSEGLVRRGAGSLRLLDFRPEEKPIGVQIFGSDPQSMAAACQVVNQYRPDLIDLNCGCPVRKVVRKNGGAALLKDLGLLERILSAVVKAARLPVTLKIRSGWAPDMLVALDVAGLAEECGAAAITIHPRTREGGFSDRADWNIIAGAKKKVNIPVIGSGDIFSPQDAKNMLDRTGCDAVMIGRASFGNPWIFSRTNHLLRQGVLLPEPSLQERIEICLEHAGLSVKEKGELAGIKTMRKHLVWYTKGMPRSKELRQKLFAMENLDQVKRALHRYLEQVNKEQQKS
jgi:tRNA-dihydrouridine synthase B